MRANKLQGRRATWFRENRIEVIRRYKKEVYFIELYNSPLALKIFGIRIELPSTRKVRIPKKLTPAQIYERTNW